MRARACGLGLLLTLAVSQAAAHSSPEPWLTGPLAYETVAPFEVDLRALGSIGPGASAQAELETGLWSHASLWARGGSGVPAWDLGTRLRFSQAGAWPLDLGAYGRLQPGLEAAKPRAGAIVARELWGNSFCANIEGGEAGTSWSAGWRSGYVLSSTRLGLSASGAASGSPTWTPQIGFYLPGEISLQLGARFIPGAAEAQGLASLSWLLFPSP